MKITYMKKTNGNGDSMVQSNSEYHTVLSAVYRLGIAQPPASLGHFVDT
jgi:hypothetical protein